ncbi:sensor histidine kinase [Paenibacillus sp. PK3_47]|uniref:sensor histidine kinase n=1 Tax=Paenibacillus sp. PK3_47 TaxID=2072642 RepID=UPI00201DBD35|nr:HAMP domain-containing sensor histidine kinase [Paenibacillus sp. PK3_47]UQZ36118.1 sensor histidine kinase [Paenibacillus sp. PK3_47]
MNREFFIGKLKLKLFLALIFSLAISTGVYFLLQTTSEGLISDYLNNTTFIERQQEDAISNFREFVNQNHIKTSDQEKITKWVRNEKYVNIYVFQNVNLIFATDGYKDASDNQSYLFNNILKTDTFYTVDFQDMKATIYMDCFFEYKFYNIVAIVNVIICSLSFILLILIFINRKTSYISVLEQEIKILEGGELNYPITIKGNDELSSLAESINEMRISFIERIENEDNAKIANKELVTAMSHDIRTPLTALVGYLDIITYEKYKTQEDLKKYLNNSRDKAYQIKHLSDKLFEYFTVSKIDEDDLEFERFNGTQLFEQLIDEQIVLLENNGFTYQINSCNTPYDIELHLLSIRRVFDNIFSNILKYASDSEPVLISFRIKDQSLIISIKNRINNDIYDLSGTGIGIKTCERIIDRLHGRFSITKTKGYFSVHISLTISEKL